MINDITLGKYYSSNSIIHKLDPRNKIFWTLLYMILVISVDNLIIYVPMTIFMFLTIYIAKIPYRMAIGTINAMKWLVIFTFILNILLTPGDILFQYGYLKITNQGLYTAITMSVRLFILVISSSVLMFTTTPLELTEGIERLLSPFKKIGLPAHELAMMMTIALRFIPTLSEEANKIMKAQMSRGADFESKNFMKRAKSMIPLLVPLFVSAFRRADELAIAMESRCYNMGVGKTKMKEIYYKKIDAISFIILIIYTASVILMVKFI